MIEFTESAYFTSPEVTDDLVAEAESRLGYALPRSYVELLRLRNGGEPIRHCYAVDFANSWAEGHIDIGAILGVGGSQGIDADTFGAGPRSPYMINEWGYPPIGIVICDTPSAGHDTVMLDYSAGGEPSVVYVDEDRMPHQIAPTFAEFLANLIECPHVTYTDAD